MSPSPLPSGPSSGKATDLAEEKAENRRSYFGAFNPWGPSRTPSSSSVTTSKDINNSNSDRGPSGGSNNNNNNGSSSSNSATTTTAKPQPSNPPPPNTTPANHTTTHLYGQSLTKYPKECPPLNVLWYHAIDVPKRKPRLLRTNAQKAQDAKSQPQPKKYIAFATGDSHAIETAYQKLLGEWEQERGATGDGSAGRVAGRKRGFNLVASPPSAKESEDSSGPRGTCVAVNEDYLFEVNIEERELNPIYWLGPTYDVRRGTWFYQEGNTLRPCQENLAAQLEEGYLKTKPWTYTETVSTKPLRSKSSASRLTVTPKASVENLKAAADSASKPERPQLQQPQTYRLFGTYMNHVATYQDSSTVWLSSESMFSWVTSYLGGTKLVRGYTEPGRAKDDGKATPTTTSPGGLQVDEDQQKLLKRRSAPAPPTTRPKDVFADDGVKIKQEEEPVPSRLTRRLSSFMGRNNPSEEEEALRKCEEEEIENDYHGQAGETQGRDIEHLILVTHGIGQLLGLRMESVNFIHDINTFRKTLKSVYTNSADLRALNTELGGGPGNCRVQVLPVCWRHLLDFPKRREKTERDVSEGLGDEDEYPSLEDITIEGMAFARSLISDLALDILLYQSAYRSEISEIVLQESNRIFQLFKEKNPEFKGKVHIAGHSLGSAIMFDILSRQKEKVKQEPPRSPLRAFWPSSPAAVPERKDPRDLAFDFDVEDFYCLGSPIGLFQMLKGRTIAARHMPNALPSESPLNPDLDDPFFTLQAAELNQRISPITGLPFSMSSPKVSQLFNIFHPSDPISYRLEPLISPMMRDLKPQAMPYTKKSIFGSMAPQGLTGIGAKVGQSVSGLFSGISAGITTSFLNRSLGLTNEDVANITAAASKPQTPSLATPGASDEPLSPSFVSDSTMTEKSNARKKELANSAMQLNRRTSSSGNELTLLDDELETLYSKFEKAKPMIAEEAETEASGEQEKRAKKLRREELKVRALNRNGRVDYCLIEGTLDINPLNALASHMCYWADEDVSHFVMSQLLSNRSRQKK